MSQQSPSFFSPVQALFSFLNARREEAVIWFLRLPVISAFFRYITPNALGYIRIVSTFLVIGLYMYDYKLSALIVYVLGAITDLIDGPLARMTNMITEEGKTLDAVADKVFILGPLLLIGFAQFHTLTIWMVIFLEILLVLTANVLKPYLRIKHGIPLSTGSNAFGQAKMVIQSFAVGITLLIPFWGDARSAGETLIWIAIACAVGSLLRHLARMDADVEPRKRIITIPNLITLSAILLFPVVITMLISEHWWIAGSMIGYFFFSDLIDGKIARALNRQTSFGAVLDPIRDALGRYLLIFWFYFRIEQIQTHVLLLAIVLTELCIAVVNFHVARTCKTVSLATRWGKYRAGIHALISSVLLLYSFGIFFLPPNATFALLFLMLFASLIALMSYVHQGARLRGQNKTAGQR